MKNSEDTSVAVFISAAGKGVRMKELTKDIPKQLININGKPLIDYLINSLYKQKNIVQLYVVYGYLKDKWHKYILSQNGTNIIFIHEFNSINLINSLFNVAKSIQENIIVVISGDMVFDYNIITKALKQHLNSENDISVALNKSSYNNYKCWDYIVSNGNIVNIVRNSKATNIERYFFIINKKVIEEYTSNFSQNMGDTIDEFKEYIEYNNGWSCLIKKLIDVHKYNIKEIYFNEPVINVNNTEDLKKAELFLVNINK